MKQNRHTLGRSIIELRMQRSADHAAIQARIGTIFRHHLAPLLEEIIDRHTREMPALRIERLVLNLGTISMRYLDEEFIGRVAEVFEKEILRQLPQVQTEIASAPSSAPGNDTELLHWYFDRGTLPWWSNAADPQVIDHALTRLAESDPAAYVALWDQIRQRAGWLKRLVLGLPDHQLMRLVHRAYPQLGRTVTEIFPALRERLRPHTSAHASDPHQLRIVLWRGMLDAAANSAVVPTEALVQRIAATWGCSAMKIAEYCRSSRSADAPSLSAEAQRVLDRLAQSPANALPPAKSSDLRIIRAKRTLEQLLTAPGLDWQRLREIAPQLRELFHHHGSARVRDLLQTLSKHISPLLDPQNASDPPKNTSATNQATTTGPHPTSAEPSAEEPPLESVRRTIAATLNNADRVEEWEAAFPELVSLIRELRVRIRAWLDALEPVVAGNDPDVFPGDPVAKFSALLETMGPISAAKESAPPAGKSAEPRRILPAQFAEWRDAAARLRHWIIQREPPKSEMELLPWLTIALGNGLRCAGDRWQWRGSPQLLTAFVPPRKASETSLWRELRPLLAGLQDAGELPGAAAERLFALLAQERSPHNESLGAIDPRLPKIIAKIPENPATEKGDAAALVPDSHSQIPSALAELWESPTRFNRDRGNSRVYLIALLERLLLVLPATNAPPHPEAVKLKAGLPTEITHHLAELKSMPERASVSPQKRDTAHRNRALSASLLSFLPFVSEAGQKALRTLAGQLNRAAFWAPVPTPAVTQLLAEIASKVDPPRRAPFRAWVRAWRQMVGRQQWDALRRAEIAGIGFGENTPTTALSAAALSTVVKLADEESIGQNPPPKNQTDRKKRGKTDQVWEDAASEMAERQESLAPPQLHTGDAPVSKSNAPKLTAIRSFIERLYSAGAGKKVTWAEIANGYTAEYGTESAAFPKVGQWEREILQSLLAHPLLPRASDLMFRHPTDAQRASVAPTDPDISLEQPPMAFNPAISPNSVDFWSTRIGREKASAESGQTTAAKSSKRSQQPDSEAKSISTDPNETQSLPRESRNPVDSSRTPTPEEIPPARRNPEEARAPSPKSSPSPSELPAQPGDLPPLAVSQNNIPAAEDAARETLAPSPQPRPVVPSTQTPDHDQNAPPTPADAAQELFAYIQAYFQNFRPANASNLRTARPSRSRTAAPGNPAELRADILRRLRELLRLSLPRAVRQELQALERLIAPQMASTSERRNLKALQQIRQGLDHLLQVLTREMHGEHGTSHTVQKFSETDSLYVANAGLVLLWPFLGRFFEKLGLMREREFVDEAARQRAVLLLQHIATGATEFPEYQLALNKLLCGHPLARPLPLELELDAETAAECQSLLEVVPLHNPKMQNLTAEGFRTAWLQREGIVKTQDDHFVLHVERKPYDILLDHLPWSVNLLRLQWMEGILAVEW